MELHPDFLPRKQTCCFTGHRVVAAQVREDVIAAVDRHIMELYHAGYRYFLAGGALGFDMLAELEVLRAARFDSDIKLILILPCRDQTARWKDMPGYLENLRQYKQILGKANAVHYITDFYTDTCMRERNRYMIDHSSACIAYYNGFPRSGAGQTFRMAEDDGLLLYNVRDELKALYESAKN